MKLTIARRIRYAWNVLTYREKHGHSAQVKALDLFMEGYDAGMKDGKQQPSPLTKK